MTNDQLHLIEEEACLMPMTICNRNKIEDLPDFLLIEFYVNTTYRNYAIWRPLIGRELEKRAANELPEEYYVPHVVEISSKRQTPLPGDNWIVDSRL